MSAAGNILDIGMIKHHEDTGRQVAHKTFELGRGDQRSGRIIGAADEDQAGALVDGAGKRSGIVIEVFALQRHWTRHPPHQAQGKLVLRECGIYRNRLVTRIDISQGE